MRHCYFRAHQLRVLMVTQTAVSMTLDDLMCRFSASTKAFIEAIVRMHKEARPRVRQWIPAAPLVIGRACNPVVRGLEIRRLMAFCGLARGRA